jgi:hypothetical protein
MGRYYVGFLRHAGQLAMRVVYSSIGIKCMYMLASLGIEHTLFTMFSPL